MTRTVSAEVYEALQQRTVVARDFIWFVVKDDNGDSVFDGYWSDVGNISAQVIDPDTGGPVTRSFFGSGTLIEADDIPMVSNLTVQTVDIRLSQCADRVNDLVRTYHCKQGRVEIFRGHYDVETHALVSPATPRFVGFIDDIQILTPAEGGDGSVTISCTSHTQEMTRSNPDTRSDASQQLRAPGDDFLVDVGVVGEWNLFWGKSSGVAPAATLANSAVSIVKNAFR